jgi:glutamate racemase
VIGVFDSGVGGLGVLAEIHRVLPTTDLVYVADTAAAPYGTRTLEEVLERSDTIARWLVEADCSVITIACNTASAAALHPLRRRYPEVAFVGMEPAIKPAASTTSTGRVGVVATAATFQGVLFSTVVDRFAVDVEVLTAACPSWVELVEAGVTGGPAARTEVESCLGPMREADIDVLVLACTHYPALVDVIAEVMGPGVRIIDPAPAVARQTQRVAAAGDSGKGNGVARLYSTGDGSSLAAAVDRLGIDSWATLLPWDPHGPS